MALGRLALRIRQAAGEGLTSYILRTARGHQASNVGQALAARMQHTDRGGSWLGEREEGM
jgi:hypothetical protein